MIALWTAVALAWAPQDGPDGPVRWSDTDIRWHFAEGTATDVAMTQELRQGFADWEDLSEGAIRFVEGRRIATAELAYDGQSQVGFAAEWNFSVTTLAVTQVWVEGSTIREFDILLQADPPGGWGGDLRSAHVYSAVLHELGHALGLGHSEVADSIMFGSIRSGEQRVLHADDREGLLALYSELPDSGIEDAGSSGCSHTGGPWGGWFIVGLLAFRRMSGSAESCEG